MREIKFRMWVNQFMYSHEEALLQEFDPRTTIKIDNEDCHWMQFTGLHDKNGKEVYEGDVVQWKRLDIKGVVYYNDEEVHYYVRALNRETESYLDLIEMEVIGSIYENPELL